MPDTISIRTGTSHRPFIIKSRKHGEFQLRSFLRMKDLEVLIEILNDKTLNSKEFTIGVLNQIAFLSEVENLSSWNEKEILRFAGRWAKKVLVSKNQKSRAENFDDFKNIASQYIVEINQNISGALKQLQTVLVESLSPQLDSMLSSITRSLEVFAKSLSEIIRTELTKVVAEFQRTLREVDETREFYEANKLLTLSQYELATLIIDSREFLKFKKGRLNANITRRLLSEIKHPQFNSYMQTLFSEPALKKRWHAIKQALTAHQQGHYFVSTPVFIAQAEGLFTDWLVIRGLAHKRTGEKLVYGEDNKGAKEIRLTSLRKKVDHAKVNFNEDFFIELTIKTVLNRIIGTRNSILHGENSNYGTARNSIQTMLLVVAFATFIQGETEYE